MGDKIKHVTGSENIFTDLGLCDSEDLLARAQLGVQILKILNKKGIEKQKDIAEILDIDKSEASKLMSNKFNRFSEGRLMSFLNKLNYKIIMDISPRHKDEAPQQVVCVL